MAKPQGTLTAGVEKEFSGLRLRSAQALADHTILFRTPSVVWQWETQGKGPKKRGQLEAVQTKNAAVAGKIREAAHEIGFMMIVLEANLGKTLADMGAMANKLLSDNAAGWRVDPIFHPNAKIVTAGQGKLKGRPQITVTHELRLVHSIFQAGRTLRARGTGLETYKDIMKRAAEVAEGVTNAYQPGRRQKDGKTPDAAKIKGYLTLLAQDLIVVFARKNEDSTYYTEGEWSKDDYGLLPKTSLLSIYDKSLSDRDKTYLGVNARRIGDKLMAEIGGDQSGELKAYNLDDGSDIALSDYIEAALTGAKKGFTGVQAWRTLLGAEAEEIVHIDDTLKYARVAFEYRSLSGGTGDDAAGGGEQRTLRDYAKIVREADAAYKAYERRHQR